MYILYITPSLSFIYMTLTASGVSDGIHVGGRELSLLEIQSESQKGPSEVFMRKYDTETILYDNKYNKIGIWVLLN